MSKKYQDLVIKDGKFIGEFEKMYQSFNDPWGQSEKIYSSSISRRSVCHFIERFGLESIVEFGCGLGHTSKYIKDETEIEILGIDIAPTSIQKASLTYPSIEFRVDDVKNIGSYKNFDCIFFSEITWYLLEDQLIDNVFSILSKEMKGKYFIHNLVFYKNQSQSYGRDYFSTFDAFIAFCPFKLLGKVESDFYNESSLETSAIFLI